MMQTEELHVSASDNPQLGGCAASVHSFDLKHT